MIFLLRAIGFILAIGFAVVLTNAALNWVSDGVTELKGLMVRPTLRQKIALVIVLPLGALLLLAGVVIVCYCFSLILSPDALWFGLPFCFVLWLLWKRSTSKLRKGIAEGLEPWLIGMTVACLVWLVATAWLPRASWSWLFRIEEATVHVKTLLEYLLPKSPVLKIAIAALLTIVSAAVTHANLWVRRYKKTKERVTKAVAFLTVLSGVTLFGSTQATNVLEKVEDEKQTRTEAQTTAVAQLLLADRFRHQAAEERAIAQEWINSVAVGAVTDVKAGDPIESDEAIREALRPRPVEEKVREAIDIRVAELRAALEAQPVVRKAVHRFGKSTSRLLGRPLGPRDRVRAKLFFESVLAEFVGVGARFTSKQLETLLEAGAADKLVQDIVVDLEQDRVKELAKAVTDPLADAFFRPSPLPRADMDARVEGALENSRPKLESLPASVRAPTVEDRIEARTREEMIKKTVERVERAH